MTVDELAEYLSALVSGGLTLDAAVAATRRFGTDEGDLRAARAEFEVRVGRIRSMTIPPSLVGPGLAPAWYSGPRPGDRFWPNVVRALNAEGWDDAAIAQLDVASSKVVGYLAPPNQDRYSYRGLVLGYVQSGKTSNFTAVIAKAADAGYRLFIVLSGIHNALRRQTQLRLERHLVLGFEQDWYQATSPDSDFRSQGNAAFALGRPMNRALAVVKKNPARLRALCRWLEAATPDVVGSCPILVIDDEADQASLDTSAADQERRSAINGLIIRMLGLIPRGCYVGYTATPFANLFVDASVPRDLYPRDFIVDLPKPAPHFGTEVIFGREPTTPEEPSSVTDGLDVVRIVPDAEAGALRPPTSRSARVGYEPTVTPSLTEAVHYFILATACRRARGQLGYSTMLVHTTMYTDVHRQYQPLLTGVLDDIRVGLQDSMFVDSLRTLWEQEVGRGVWERVGQVALSFEEIRPYIPRVLDEGAVIVDNSRSDDRLTYEDGPRTVIVVGGNTLSRGLTLEGLMVSYFLRTASTYDTLLQMGRWFGFRRGYEDLPRLYMTDELEDAFIWLAGVEDEIRRDIQRYELEGLTPLDFSVRIRTHPKLAITQALKMQHAIDASMSYEGRRVQTILFDRSDRNWLVGNIVAARSLVTRAVAHAKPLHDSGRWLVHGIESVDVLAFLEDYVFHANSRDMRRELLMDYVSGETRSGGITAWNLAVMGQAVDRAGHIELGLPALVNLIVRARLPSEGPANIKALMSKVDRCIDLGHAVKDLAAMDDAALVSLRQREAPTTGLILLYPISRRSEPHNQVGHFARVPLDAVEDVIGAALVFPGNRNATSVTYKTADLSRVIREEILEADVPD